MSANQASSAGESTTSVRRAEVHDFKRQRILDAGAAVFSARGLEGASLRAIAAEAGYTPAALYSYFDSKEAIYADLLGQSLERLDATLLTASEHGSLSERARGCVLAFFHYYRDHPDELDLGLYLFAGVDRRGLTPALDRKLNDQLQASVQRMAVAVRNFRGGTRRTAERDVVGAICHMVGGLTLERAGRLKLWGQDAAGLMAHHVEALLQGPK